MKSSNIKPLKSCPMCDKNEVFATYEEKARYRYKCNHCGQYFEFNAPSQFAVDVVEVKHGEWINVYMSSPSSFSGTCSVCRVTNDIPPPALANYCPNCGAKMDKEKGEQR